MKYERYSSQSGYCLANEGLGRIVCWANGYSAHEREHLQAVNQPKVASLQTKRARLTHKQGRLIRQIESLEIRAAGEPASALDLILAVCFALAGFVLARKTVEPFGLGSIGDLFAAGLALLAPYATERFLRRFSRRVIVAALLDITVFLTAIATLILFAEIRADVFRHQIDGGAAVVFDTGSDRLPEPSNGPEPVADLLRWAMILAALGFELASGLNWHDFLEGRRRASSGLLRQLQKRLEETEKELLSVMIELQQALSEPSRVYARFWAEFQQGLFDGMARIGRNSCVILIVLLTMTAGLALRGAENLHMIAGIDLSQTEQVKGLNGRSEFQENIEGISRLLADLPAGSRVTVVGITGASLMTPYTLLSAEVSADSGYFESRLKAARRTLVAAWSTRGKNLEPIAPHTDILGALQYGSQLLSRLGARRKVVVVFSDMRHEANGLDLERPELIDVKRTLKYVEQWKLVAPLPGVEVFVFGAGAHSAGKDLRYWRGLQEFWTEYFRLSGANLRVFSTTREAEALRAVTLLPPARTGLP